MSSGGAMNQTMTNNQSPSKKNIKAMTLQNFNKKKIQGNRSIHKSIVKQFTKFKKEFNESLSSFHLEKNNERNLSLSKRSFDSPL